MPALGVLLVSTKQDWRPALQRNDAYLLHYARFCHNAWCCASFACTRQCKRRKKHSFICCWSGNAIKHKGTYQHRVASAGRVS